MEPSNTQEEKLGRVEKNHISFEDFKKVEIKIGKILSAEKVPETDKLLKLSVEMGEGEPRTIVSGISQHFEDLEKLVGTTCAFATNIEPRKIRGIESNGMILAVSDEEGNFSLLKSEGVKAGVAVK